jgi:hypothetical protein
VACPDNSEGDVITFEKNSEEMDATRLEVNPEETEAAVERPELFEKEKTYAENIGSSDINAWPYDVAKGLRSGSKTVLDPGRSRLLSASESYVAPSLQCARDRCVKVQERTTL